MSNHYHTIIIGSGTSAYYCASGLLAAGQKLAIVDGRPFGGTCALRGCQPKKYLVANAEAVASGKHLLGKGLRSAPETDWAALQSLKNEFLDGLSEESQQSWVDKGVTTYRQQARLSGEQEVTLQDGTVLTADRIVLATGSVSRPLAIPGSELAGSSDDFLDLAELPKRIVFIGGGYISFEFAHVAAQAGAEVTILHRSAQVLKGFEPDMVAVIVASSREAGIRIEVDTEPTQIVKEESGLVIETEGGQRFETDFIVSAAGRVPNLSILEGGEGQVDHSGRGVEVNDYYQSVSNPAVYAIGDCASKGPMLATVGDEQGKIAARNILEGNTTVADLSCLATAVFTIPTMGSVGLTEEQAKAAGHDFRVNQGETTGWPSSKRIGEKFGAYKVLVDNQSDLILGAHLVRHNAGEVVNTFALAMAHQIPAKTLANFLWAYPTNTSDLKNMVG